MNWIYAIANDLKHIAMLTWQNIRGVTDDEFDKPWELHTDGKSSVIILLHGSAANQNEWKESEIYLKKHFSDHPIYAFSMDLKFDVETGRQINIYGKYCHSLKSRRVCEKRNASIDEYTHTLNDYVSFLNARYPGRDIVLIGHSMGGLVAVRYVSQLLSYPMSAVVKKVVTIASPLQGAPLLENRLLRSLLNTNRHQDMTPKSRMLLGMHHDLVGSPRKQNLEIRCFASQQDIHVPVEYARLDCEPNDNEVIAQYGHFSIVNSAVLWDRCAQFVKNSIIK